MVNAAHPRKRTAGISLLEIMVVLAIIALVAGLAAPRLMGSFGRAKSMVAEASMENVRGALQLYYIDVGRYPSEAEGLQALVYVPAAASVWRGPYVESLEDLKDPWGRQLLYRTPGKEKAFDLSTLGRDGRPGGESEDRDLFR